MSLIESIIISIGVAMDALALAICKGLSMSKIYIKKIITIGLWFGIFQMLMPILGFLLGKSFAIMIMKIDHWLSFILLTIIGLNMLKESFEIEYPKYNDNTNFKEMFYLSIASSIDALTVGITYAIIYGNHHAFLTFSLIGIITFTLSCLGVIIGHKFGSIYKNKAQLIGGLLLIIMGIKILLSHLKII
jgi:putative Mn2+ efflux pump MntP